LMTRQDDDLFMPNIDAVTWFTSSSYLDYPSMCAVYHPSVGNLVAELLFFKEQTRSPWPCAGGASVGLFDVLFH